MVDSVCEELQWTSPDLKFLEAKLILFEVLWNLEPFKLNGLTTLCNRVSTSTYLLAYENIISAAFQPDGKPLALQKLIL